ncbi:Rib/alpha-like domain-containing protein, partial [Facklamia sp. P12955]|uniref:Rib/alpha-like domain-containing protein n=1 Tax=Facklamia sp. P12955 TaxID=3421946 RepID=UPI003D16B684
IPDDKEIEAGSDPKDPNSLPLTPISPIEGLEEIADQTVVEGKPIKDIMVTPDNEGATVEVTELPDGLTYDPETGTITGTPNVDDWKDDLENNDFEEEREIPIKIKVTNPGGSSTTETVTITVQRDTDKDGVPDVTDPDDDGDGVADQEEIDKGTNPKDPNSLPLTPISPIEGLEEIADQTVVEGKPIKDIMVTPDNEGATVEVTELPDGLTYDPETGTITGTPNVDDWKDDLENNDFEEEREIPIKIKVTNPGGSSTTETVTITVQRDTDKDGVPDVTDPDDDGDGVADQEEIDKGTNPKDPNSRPSENELTDADKNEPIGKDIETEIGQVPNSSEGISNKDDLPEGTKIEWVVEPDVSKPGKSEGVIRVTYPDGSSETIKVNVIVSDKKANISNNNGSTKPENDSPSKSEMLPTTGESDNLMIFSGVALSILSGLGLIAVGGRKKEEN